MPNSEDKTDQRQRVSRSPNRVVAIVLGAIYLIVGFVGFAVTASVGFLSSQGGELFGIFETNGLLNVIHVVIGAALLLAGTSGLLPAKTVNVVSGIVFLILGIVGLFIASSDSDVLALNTPDQVLHLASAVVLLSAGVGADRRSQNAIGAH